MKIPLQKYKSANTGMKHLKDMEPFLKNDRAVLIHRPRSAALYKLRDRRAHLAIHLWCGNCFTGMDKFSALPEPPEDMLVCKVCEEKAVEAGELTSSQLAGRHVCTGGVKAINTCCGDKDV